MPSRNPLTAEQRATVDEYGRLYNESQAWAPKERKLKLLRDEIQTWYPKLGQAETELAVGHEYEVQISERAIVKSWKSITAVAKAAGGWPKLQKICTVTFKALSGVIGNTAAEALQVEEQTGHRKLKAVAIFSVPCERIVDNDITIPAELPKAA